MRSYTGTGYTIYAHINKANGKMYIGQTRQANLKRRWNGGSSYSGCTHFYAAIKKYGWDGFEHEIWKTGLTKEEADAYERVYINFFETNNPAHGYNVQSGGRSAGGMSEYGRQSLIKHNLGENSPRHRAVVVFDSEGHKINEFPVIGFAADFYGINHSSLNTHLRKGSGTCKGMIFRYKDDVGDAAFLPSEEVYRPHEKRTLRIEKSPKVCKDRSQPRPYRRKALYQYDKDGHFLREFASAFDVEENLGIKASTVHGAVYSSSWCGGFLWRNADGNKSDVVPPRVRGELKRLTGGSTARKVDQIDPFTGEVVHTFVSLREAARAVNRDKSNIANVANGKKLTCAGYKWLWHENDK